MNDWIHQESATRAATNTVLGYIPTIKKTNADRIRAMTDEELAKLLSGMSCRRCPISCKGGFQNCTDFWLDWLKQEATE